MSFYPSSLPAGSAEHQYNACPPTHIGFDYISFLISNIHVSQYLIPQISFLCITIYLSLLYSFVPPPFPLSSSPSLLFTFPFTTALSLYLYMLICPYTSLYISLSISHTHFLPLSPSLFLIHSLLCIKDHGALYNLCSASPPLADKMMSSALGMLGAVVHRACDPR